MSCTFFKHVIKNGFFLLSQWKFPQDEINNILKKRMNELCSFYRWWVIFYLIVSVVLVASEIHTHVVYEGQTNTAEACDSTN